MGAVPSTAGRYYSSTQPTCTSLYRTKPCLDIIYDPVFKPKCTTPQALMFPPNCSQNISLFTTYTHQHIVSQNISLIITTYTHQHFVSQNISVITTYTHQHIVSQNISLVIITYTHQHIVSQNISVITTYTHQHIVSQNISLVTKTYNHRTCCQSGPTRGSVPGSRVILICIFIP